MNDAKIIAESQKLIDRLCNNPEKKLVNFHVDWGPEAHKLSVEERAKVINDVLDQIENGDYEEHYFED
jgi:hypothetical protein